MGKRLVVEGEKKGGAVLCGNARSEETKADATKKPSDPKTSQNLRQATTSHSLLSNGARTSFSTAPDGASRRSSYRLLRGSAIVGKAPDATQGPPTVKNLTRALVGGRQLSGMPLPLRMRSGGHTPDPTSPVTTESQEPTYTKAQALLLLLLLL